MSMPYKGTFKVVSPYGQRIDPITGIANTWHSGVDLVGDNKDILSVKDGLVLRSGIVTDTTNLTSEWGNYIAILSGEHLYYYCHLSERLVQDGETVKEGQIIGIEGSTGRSTGSHLHFEVRKNNISTDPTPFIGIPNTAGYIYSPAVNNDIPWWAREALEWANKTGIMIGDENGDLMSQKNATRGEIAVMLFRLYNLLSHQNT